MKVKTPVILFICKLTVFILVTIPLSRALSRTQFRLTDGGSPNEGFLEVSFHRRTRRVCSHAWDTRNSRVLCRQLGYSDFLSNTTRTSNEIKYTRNFWKTLYFCQGRERSLLECRTDILYRFMIAKHCSDGNIVWITCANTTRKTKPTIPLVGKEIKGFALRLSNDENNKHDIINKGVLEIGRNNKWNYVCGDNWTHMNSRVACGNLGYPYAKATDTLKKSNLVDHYTTLKFNCSGKEPSLLTCLVEESAHDLDCHKGHVTIECAKVRDKFGDLLSRKEAETGLVRLRSGHREFEGRVEVFMNGIWSTVCDDTWDIDDATVVCRQLGFGTAREALPASYFGEGIGKILVSSVNCTGNESTLLDCAMKSPIQGCGHFHDSGVRCNYPKPNFPKMRLAGGKTPKEGRVEIYHNRRWYGVCGIDFDDLEGRVVCRELGLGFLKEASNGDRYGVRYEKLLYNLNCKGDEKSLLNCRHLKWPIGRCTYYAMAFVKCTDEYPDIVVDLQALTSTIMLANIKLFVLTCAKEENCLSSSAYQQHLKINSYYDKKYTRKLLRFSARMINKGTSAFRPKKRKSKWIWHSCHKHFHSIERFSDFDIIDFFGRKVAEGHKASFCLEDTDCNPGYQQAFNCTNKGDQGISVNCADNYKYTVDCQWVDITDIKEGNYSLLVHINPKHMIGESDYSNNFAACEVDYHNGNVTIGHCSSDPCHVRSYGGTGYGMCCHFPFVYKGKTYYECTSDGFDHNWCSTTTNFDNDKKWGYCELQKALMHSSAEKENTLRAM